MPRVYGTPAGAEAAAPTPGVFGFATILRGSGVVDDPYVVLYVGDHANFNASPISPAITFPQAPSGMLRMKYLGFFMSAGAAGIAVMPYVSILNTATGVADAVPLGSRVTTTSASERWTWDECKGLEIATIAGIPGSVSAVVPFRFDVIGYAATDDAYITIEFEWWS